MMTKKKEKTFAQLFVETRDSMHLSDMQMLEDMSGLVLRGLFVALSQTDAGLNVSKIATKFFNDGLESKNQKQRDALTALAEKYLETVQSSPPFTDVFETLASEGFLKSLGQFMTPSDLAQLICKVNIELKPPPVSDFFKLGDPTGCGMGGLILGFLRELHSKSPNSIKFALIEAVDIDLKMCKFTATQLLASFIMHNIRPAGLVIHCENTLLLTAEQQAMCEKAVLVFRGIRVIGLTDDTIPMLEKAA